MEMTQNQCPFTPQIGGGRTFFSQLGTKPSMLCLDLTAMSSAISLYDKGVKRRSEGRVQHVLLKLLPLIPKLAYFRKQDTHFSGESLREVVDVPRVRRVGIRVSAKDA